MKRENYRSLFTSLLFAGIALFAGHASALSITVKNFSFEDPPDQGNSGASITCPVFWTCSPVATGAFNVGYYSPVNSQYPAGANGLPAGHTVPLDGSTRTNAFNVSGGYQALYENFNFGQETVTQNTTETIKNSTTYTLNAWVGHRNDTAFGGAIIELLANGTVFAATGLNAVPSISDPGSGKWAQYTLTFTTAASDPNFGKTLGIGLLNVTGGQTNFDVVTLTCNTSGCSAPEPATLLLMAIGLGSLALTGRRKERSRLILR